MNEGNVLRYKSERENSWCREGTAIVHRMRDGRLVAIDTYWECRSPEDHVLTNGELTTATVLFNLGDYDKIDRQIHPPWNEYATEDRQIVTAQHGLRRTLYLRKGARPSAAEKVRKHISLLREARNELRIAQSRVKWAERDLAASWEARGGGRG